MKKLSTYLDNLEENIITVLLPAMCLLVFASTFFRYTKLLIIPWAEELARYLMVWIVFLGVGTAAKKGSHFAVEVFVKAWPARVQKGFMIARFLIVTVFCAMVIKISITIAKAQMMMEQISPALKLPMWIPYSAIPIGCLLMIIRSAQQIYSEHFKKNITNEEA